MGEAQITKNQHFVPQTYLRGFSDSDKFIYQFDKKHPEKGCVKAPIENICSEKYLYELKEANGQIILPNHIENKFAQFETGLSRVIHSIEKRARIPENCKSTMFLTKEEKAYLLLFICGLVVRHPDVIQSAQCITNDELKLPKEDLEGRNLYLAMISDFASLDRIDKYLPEVIVKQLMGGDPAFFVLFADEPCFVTSDWPIVAEQQEVHDEQHPQIEKILFPLSKHLAVYLTPRKIHPPGERNKLRYLPSYKAQEIKGNILTGNGRWVYSSHPLSEDDVKAATAFPFKERYV